MANNNRVMLELPLLRDGEDQDVLVGLNGVMYRIKRGCTVRVPEGVKEILDQQNEYYVVKQAYEEKEQKRSSRRAAAEAAEGAN